MDKFSELTHSGLLFSTHFTVVHGL